MPLPTWNRAHGEPVLDARLRVQPEDFRVVEDLGWDLSGDGEHDYLWIEKTGANTEWVARQLARFAEVPAKDVGYAGLKDRHAITQQWFSVPRWHGPNWQALAVEGVTVLAVERHLRKLRRGAHRANRFQIFLRADDIDRAACEQRMTRIQEQGVPNYFGEQRFGRNASNLQLADEWAGGKRLPRHLRALAISTVRSFLFNEALSDRVVKGTWNQLRVGDAANLDGSASLFDITEVDAVLAARCDAMDIHPSIELAGQGSAVQPDEWRRALDKARVEPGDRSLRLRVADLNAEHSNHGLMIGFRLPRGAFATAVLRELCHWQ